MKIIYVTNTGTTKKYAEALGEKLSAEVFPIEKAGDVSAQEEIVFLGWMMAGTLQGYAKIKEAFKNIKAVCAVGMMSSDSKKGEIIEKNAITEELFILPGAFDMNKLSGLYKMMMGMAVKMIKSKLKESNDPKDKEAFEKFEEGFDMFSEENLGAVVEYLM